MEDPTTPPNSKRRNEAGNINGGGNPTTPPGQRANPDAELTPPGAPRRQRQPRPWDFSVSPPGLALGRRGRGRRIPSSEMSQPAAATAGPNQGRQGRRTRVLEMAQADVTWGLHPAIQLPHLRQVVPCPISSSIVYEYDTSLRLIFSPLPYKLDGNLTILDTTRDPSFAVGFNQLDDSFAAATTTRTTNVPSADTTAAATTDAPSSHTAAAAATTESASADNQPSSRASVPPALSWDSSEEESETSEQSRGYTGPAAGAADFFSPVGAGASAGTASFFASTASSPAAPVVAAGVRTGSPVAAGAASAGSASGSGASSSSASGSGASSSGASAGASGSAGAGTTSAVGLVTASVAAGAPISTTAPDPAAAAESNQPECGPFRVACRALRSLLAMFGRCFDSLRRKVASLL
ncbi:hypothetical protein B0H66DRAFT_535219 [Apodospora peruviana]|uniref:Uncharacterized protein n=1 Tax=Apodospora peruviana TaxID=516989 RepID=A0AAE0M2Q4_9PEZI|nr:hypothetical protein B0H66DRAFT_535219 [Apodospora peruviana]